MTLQHADSIFRSTDDLQINPPVGNFPPTQIFSPFTGTPNRRQSAGDYSWMATVVPTLGPSNAGDSQIARVSIVVFYKRNLIQPVTPLSTSAPSERMVALNVASGNNGAGGGDCDADLFHGDLGRLHQSPPQPVDHAQPD